MSLRAVFRLYSDDVARFESCIFRADSRVDVCLPLPNNLEVTQSAQTLVDENTAPVINTEKGINQSENHKSDSPQSGSSDEDSLQRPNTLRFLAASVAFQSSTVPALKRLPYTPDPGTALNLLVCLESFIIAS